MWGLFFWEILDLHLLLPSDRPAGTCKFAVTNSISTIRSSRWGCTFNKLTFILKLAPADLYLYRNEATMKKHLLFALLFVSTLTFAQTDSSIVKPCFAIKYNPTSLLSIDPNIQFQLEYFMGKQSSIEVGYGVGNKRIFKNNPNIKTDVYRLEYKHYLRPFAQNKRWVNYVAGEIVYKKVLQKKSSIRVNDAPLNDALEVKPFTLTGNDIVPHVKIGRAWLGKDGHALNMYAGIGARFRNNKSSDIGSDFAHFTDTDGFFYRTLGKRTQLSPTIGLSFGFHTNKK